MKPLLALGRDIVITCLIHSVNFNLSLKLGPSVACMFLACFLQAGCPFCCPANSVKALEAFYTATDMQTDPPGGITGESHLSVCLSGESDERMIS